MSKRLFVASGIFHPEPGGPATYLHEVLPALQSHGWSVRLLTFGEGKTDYPYPVTRVPRNFLPLRYARYAAHAFAELRRADVAYAHTLDLPLVTRWQALPHVPRVLKVVGDLAWERAIRKHWIAPTTDVDHFQTMNASDTVQQARNSRSLQAQAMQHVIVPSEYLKQMVVAWGVDASKISVIYNALPPMIGERRTQSEARTLLGLDDRPTLLTAARLTPWKGVDHLITALHTLPDIRLLVAGEGEETPRLQEMAASLGDRVVFLGRLEREFLYQYMQAADYFVLYSGYEGLAHTLLESLRVGTPLIASSKGGNVEVVRNGINGLLVDYVNMDALIAALRQAFSGDTRARLSASTSQGMERFTFETMVNETHRALERIV